MSKEAKFNTFKCPYTGDTFFARHGTRLRLKNDGDPLMSINDGADPDPTQWELVSALKIDGSKLIRSHRAKEYWGSQRWVFNLFGDSSHTVPCTTQGWIDITHMEPPQGINCAHYLHDDTRSEVTVGQFYGMKHGHPDGLIEMINEHGRPGHKGPCIVLCNRWQPMPVADG